MNLNELKQMYDQLPNTAKRESIRYLKNLLAHSSKLNAYVVSPKTKITDSPYIGIWKDRKDITNSSLFVKDLRQKQWKRN